MTTAVISVTQDGEYRKIQCLGHAGYAKWLQKDLVCCAISVLMINTINSIEELTDDQSKLSVVTNESEGLIQCTFEEHLSDKTNLLIKSLILGLHSIEQQYGNRYFELKFEEV